MSAADLKLAEQRARQAEDEIEVLDKKVRELRQEVAAGSRENEALLSQIRELRVRSLGASTCMVC